MKRITYIITSLILLVSLASCATKIDLDEKTYEVDSTCENIIVEEAVMNVEIRKDSKVKNITVTYYEKEEKYYLSNNYSNVTKTYKAQRVQPNKKLDYSFSSDYKTLVLVPEDFGGTVNVRTGVGNINLSNFNSKDLTVTSSVGNINISNLSSDAVEVKNSTGNIIVEGLDASTLQIKNSTGNIKVNNVVVDNEIKLENSSGNIDGNNVKGLSVNAKNSLGNVSLLKLDVSSFVEVKNATGNVTLSVTGDKDLYTTTLSSGIGSTKGEATGGDIRINIETEVGDIKVSYNA